MKKKSNELGKHHWISILERDFFSLDNEYYTSSEARNILELNDIIMWEESPISWESPHIAYNKIMLHYRDKMISND